MATGRKSRRRCTPEAHFKRTASHARQDHGTRNTISLLVDNTLPTSDPSATNCRRHSWWPLVRSTRASATLSLIVCVTTVDGPCAQRRPQTRKQAVHDTMNFNTPSCANSHCSHRETLTVAHKITQTTKRATAGANLKGTGREGALLRDVYGSITPKETCTCRVRAHGGG